MQAQAGFWTKRLMVSSPRSPGFKSAKLKKNLPGRAEACQVVSGFGWSLYELVLSIFRSSSPAVNVLPEEVSVSEKKAEVKRKIEMVPMTIMSSPRAGRNMIS